jgi:hypothetical protein
VTGDIGAVVGGQVGVLCPDGLFFASNPSRPSKRSMEKKDDCSAGLVELASGVWSPPNAVIDHGECPRFRIGLGAHFHGGEMSPCCFSVKISVPWSESFESAGEFKPVKETSIAGPEYAIGI